MRILMVEDEVALADSVRRRLTSDGFVVQVEHDGKAGLEAALSESFDAVVLDIMLPGLSGYEVLRQMRRNKVWSPVIMLTAKSGLYEQTDAFELGADDYLTKPFSIMILSARLRALGRRRLDKAPVIYTSDSLTVDPRRRIASRSGVDIELTPREFGLLEYLIRNQGQVLSKHDILMNVWDAAYEGPEGVVEVYIGYLRRKIDTPFGVVSIHTRRGLGYQLGPERPATAE